VAKDPEPDSLAPCLTLGSRNDCRGGGMIAALSKRKAGMNDGLAMGVAGATRRVNSPSFARASLTNVGRKRRMAGVCANVAKGRGRPNGNISNSEGTDCSRSGCFWFAGFRSGPRAGAYPRHGDRRQGRNDRRLERQRRDSIDQARQRRRTFLSDKN
jgi:hypothetical protein